MSSDTHITEIRACAQCEKRFFLHKGFFPNTTGYKEIKETGITTKYLKICKACYGKNKLNKKHADRNFTFEIHAWGPEVKMHATCKRCNVERKRAAHPYKAMAYYCKYLVNKKWVDEIPTCIKSKNAIDNEQRF